MPESERTYHEERNKLYTEKLRALLEQLPDCCRPYFRSLETLTTPLTRYAYAIDLSGFFSYAFRFFPGRGNRLIIVPCTFGTDAARNDIDSSVLNFAG